jgi:hypothetical protein
MSRNETQEQFRSTNRSIDVVQADVKGVKKTQELLGNRVLDNEEAIVEHGTILAAHGHSIDDLFKAVKMLQDEMLVRKPESSAFSRSDAAEGFYPKNTTCAFDIPFVSEQATLSGMRAYLRDTVTNAAGVDPSSLKRIETIGDLKYVDGVKVQAWKFVWQDCETAGLVIRARGAIRKKLHIYMTDDLTWEQRQLKKSRKWAYNLLRDRRQCWVMWRFADIYINTTVELDESSRDAEGNFRMINRGRWTCLSEEDYEELKGNEVGDEDAEC